MSFASKVDEAYKAGLAMAKADVERDMALGIVRKPTTSYWEVPYSRPITVRPNAKYVISFPALPVRLTVNRDTETGDKVYYTPVEPGFYAEYILVASVVNGVARKIQDPPNPYVADALAVWLPAFKPVPNYLIVDFDKG